MTRLEGFLFKKFLKRKGIDLDKGTIDTEKVKIEMTAIITALLGFFSSPAGESLLAKADVELLALVNIFIKGHVKAATLPVTPTTTV